MRIGTWNLQGRWDQRHAALLSAHDCDVWLLTEVPDRAVLDGWHGHATTVPMAARRAWAAVWSRQPLRPLGEPHGATAAAQVGELTCWSSILPWRGCGSGPPWTGGLHADKTGAAVDELRVALPASSLVWGGDWNHALSGTEHAGSKGGREHVLALVGDAGLQVPTAALPHRIPDLLSIDHVAVPEDWRVAGAERLVAEADGARLSDHDAYVVEVS